MYAPNLSAHVFPVQTFTCEKSSERTKYRLAFAVGSLPMSSPPKSRSKFPFSATS